MGASEVERLATLEADMANLKADVGDIKKSLKALEQVALRGGGAFHAILLIGGVIGWLVGIGVAIFAALHR